MIRVEFEIANNGPAPANDILAEIHFPDKARPYKKDQLATLLRNLPAPPQNPSSFSPFILPRGLASSINQPLMPRTVFGPTLSIRHVDSYEVTWKALKLRQGHTEIIDPLLVVFEDQPFSFDISYVLVADNSKDIVRGILHVVVQGTA